VWRTHVRDAGDRWRWVPVSIRSRAAWSAPEWAPSSSRG